MPVPSEVHVDAALSTVSRGYAAQATKFVSNRVFPVVTVTKESGKYFIVDRYQNARRQHDDIRAAGTEAHETDFKTSTDTYLCNDHAEQGIVPDEERANADDAMVPELNRTEFLTDIVLLNKEIALVTLLEATLASSGTNLTNLTNEWDDYTNGDPVGDMRTAITRFIANSAGVIPSGVVIPQEVFLALKDHPDIVDRVKYGSALGTPSVVTAQALAAVFGIGEVLIAQCYKNTAKHNATPVGAAIWGENDVVLYYRPERVGLKVQSLGFTFAWTMGGATQEGYQVETWRENGRKGDMYRVSFYYDQKVVDSTCGYRIANTLS